MSLEVLLTGVTFKKKKKKYIYFCVLCPEVQNRKLKLWNDTQTQRGWLRLAGLRVHIKSMCRCDYTQCHHRGRSCRPCCFIARWELKIDAQTEYDPITIEHLGTQVSRDGIGLDGNALQQYNHSWTFWKVATRIKLYSFKLATLQT